MQKYALFDQKKSDFVESLVFCEIVIGEDYRRDTLLRVRLPFAQQ
jgi:hypothetical protein